jgi:acetyl esterase/lipase
MMTGSKKANNINKSVVQSNSRPAPPELSTEPPDKSFMSDAYFDIPYANISDTQKLDIYQPKCGKQPVPVLLYFHGGGWIMSDKQEGIKSLAEQMLAAGYAFISANYRFSSEAKFPAQIQDAKAVVRWIRANSAKYWFDSSKIVTGGDSAGGYLAALLGTSGGIADLEDLSLGNSEQSSRVNAVIDWFGPLDFLSMDIQHTSLGQQGNHSDPDSPESQFIGGSINDFAEKCRKANPINYLKPDNPPFFIIHGKADGAVPYLQSVTLADKLKSTLGVGKVHLELVENAGHLDPILFKPRIIKKVLDFLGTVLKHRDE